MAKKNVAYHNVDMGNLSTPLVKLSEKAQEAVKAFDDALIASAKKKGVIPNGMYGKVSRSFGKVAIAVSDEPFPEGSAQKTVTL